jgi:hypothetical protein
MIVFDSVKKSAWTGGGFNLDNKKIKCLQLCFLDQTIALRAGEFQAKLHGKRNSGNGYFTFQIISGDQVFFEKKINFINNNPTTLTLNFNINSPGIYKVKIVRDNSSIGTITFDSIRVLYLQEVISSLFTKEDIKISPIRLKEIEKEQIIIDNKFANYTKVFLIDDPDVQNESIENFIKNNGLNISNTKILNIFSSSYNDKKYNTLIDKRVFESIGILSEFLEINNPDLIVIFSQNEMLSNLKNTLNLNFLITNGKIDRNLKIKKEDNEPKKSSFIFGGTLL